ncbi:MAG: hypothetical protein LBB81_01240 [Treponema sp.]|jgi:hypothetical protein|nr:hypothetical protein [Treponema sp.]
MSEEQEKKNGNNVSNGNKVHEGSKQAKAAEVKDLITRQLIAKLEQLMHDFMDDQGIGANLTGSDRRRLVGAGVRNYGFIDKAFDIARDNPEFMPAHFDVALLNWNMHELEDFRQLMWLLQQFTQAASNAFLLQADACYRDALRIYGSLQEQARNRVPGADILFRALQTFFSRTRRQPADEPTEMELERDIKRLIHGKADGEIVIKNETPHVSGGVHEVVDNVRIGRSAFKGTVEESEKGV